MKTLSFQIFLRNICDGDRKRQTQNRLSIKQVILKSIIKDTFFSAFSFRSFLQGHCLKINLLIACWQCKWPQLLRRCSRLANRLSVDSSERNMLYLIKADRIRKYLVRSYCFSGKHSARSPDCFAHRISSCAVAVDQRDALQGTF